MSKAIPNTEEFIPVFNGEQRVERSIDLQRLESSLNSNYHHWIYQEPDGKQSLLEFLKDALPHISSDSWKKRFWLGGVYVNGRLRESDSPLPSSARIEYFEPRYPAEEAQEYFPRFQEQHIVFEDDDLLVVFKPQGLPTLATREQRRYTLKQEVEDYLKLKTHFPSRLDTSTLGLVPIAKSDQMAKRLQRLFERRLVHKSYMLYTAYPAPAPTFRVERAIGRAEEHPILRVIDEQNGVFARTDFELLGGKAEHGWLLKAIPYTGRTHQIRVHAQSVGCPIDGDEFYCGRAAEALHLMCWSLELLHPLSEQQLRLRVPETLLPCWAKLESSANSTP